MFGLRRRWPTARESVKTNVIDQEWKLRVRQWRDTFLALTINHANLSFEVVVDMTPPALYEEPKCLGSEGSMVARLKLKGIAGRAQSEVEPAAQLDSARGNLPGPDIARIDRLMASYRLYGWCFKAAFRWWGELPGYFR